MHECLYETFKSLLINEKYHCYQRTLDPYNIILSSESNVLEGNPLS